MSLKPTGYFLSNVYCFEHRTMYIMPSGECIEIKPGEKTSNSLHKYNCKVNYFVYIIKCRTDKLRSDDGI